MAKGDRYITDNKEIAHFCSHCDWKDDRVQCPPQDQYRYVIRDWCGWSYIQGVRVVPVTKATIKVGDVEYQREDLDQIMQAVAAAKQEEKGR